MYPSTYLSWFRRLLILGAVVAGLTASAAGARLDPGTPPDVSDVKSALSAQATIVSRPPDVQDAATSVNAAAPDVFERYAAAHPSDTRLFTGYGTETYSYPDPSLFHAPSSVSTPPDVQDAMRALHSTPEGLKADGMRLQGIARTDMQLQSRGIAPTWEHQLHSPNTASQYPTPAGLKADGLRWQGIAQVYKQQSVESQGGSSFNYGDWAIGVGSGLGLALLLGVGIIVGRQQRRVQPA